MDSDLPIAEPHDASAATTVSSTASEAYFDVLARRYNFLNTPPFGEVFADLVIDEARRRGPGCRILDVGCGAGIGRSVQLQWNIKQAASELWGLEPDPEIAPEPGLFDHFEHALMETARLPEGSFDMAYSAMVMEHVSDPVLFLKAVHRCLKPGGSYIFVTPNARSFVPWATKILHILGVDEIALRVVRGEAKVEEYHYPVQFRCNHPKQLDRLARESGFLPPDYAFVEGPGALSYLRGPLAPLKSLIKWKRRLVRDPSRLATLICRMTKD